MALMLMAGWDEWLKLGALAGLTVLAGPLIWYGGDLMLPERQAWKHLPR
jgi:hypothetical protein